jgi:hypothetical protein
MKSATGSEPTRSDGTPSPAPPSLAPAAVNASSSVRSALRVTPSR